MATALNQPHDIPTIQSSQAEVWYLKQISFRGRNLQIITQNFNGPCSFIAICNILILRGNIRILPISRTTVSYEFLSQLVAEYLLTRSPDVDLSDALSIMPHTQKGLDLNPLFTSSTAFRPATSTAGGELKLFAQADIHLVHGWLVDPGSEEADALKREGIEDYDSAVGFIAEADFLGGGVVVGDGSGGKHVTLNTDRGWTDEERRKIKNAIIIRHFLESTQSQLTYHGLFHLASTLPPGALVALFRSSHLAVLVSDGAGNGGFEVIGESDNRHQVNQPQISQAHHSALLRDQQYVPPSNLRTPSISPNNEGPRVNSESPTPLQPQAHSDVQTAPVIHTPAQPRGSGELLSQAQAPTDQSQHSSRNPFRASLTQPPEPLSTQSPANTGIYEASSHPVTHQGPSHEVSHNPFLPASQTLTYPAVPDVNITAHTSHNPFSQVSSNQTRPASGTHNQPSIKTISHSPQHADVQNQDRALYTLVTDQVFLTEPSVVWERIEDVDGAAGGFVDGALVKSSPAGGDWAGRTAEEAARTYQDVERAAAGIGFGLDGQTDLEIARQLQAEEEHYAQREREIYYRERQRREQDRRREEEGRHQKELQRRADAQRKEKKKDCIIM